MSYLSWITFAPLLGAIVNGFFGRKLPRMVSGIIGCAGPIASFVLGVMLLLRVHGEGSFTETATRWFAAGTFSVDIAWRTDELAAVMVLIVAGVGSLIHIYSIEYMKDDEGFARFFAYLNLFMFSMLTLVLGANLVMMFLGWEGVGLCSYLLIGFWWQEGKNADAGKKAFITNRIGDFGFVLGIFFLFAQYGTVDFADLWTAISAHPAAIHLLWIPALLLFLGACGKSAQIPLYVWLPDAMAGPTPVSALIHAATMVTAGVYMMGRMHFVYGALPADVLQVVVLVGAATALLAAVIAIAQTDIKKILAYSTVSQLGFMFCGMATTHFQTGIFHVTTHAFFKALLFLGAGAVIYAMHHEQDIRKMGGLRRELPLLATVFLIGSLALAGFPLLSGFFSKDAILAAVHEQSVFPVFGLAWVMLLATAGITAFYSTRLYCVVFLGERAAPSADHVVGAHGEDAAHAHGGIQKPGILMMAPLVILAVLSAFGGAVLQKPVEEFLGRGWNPAPATMERWVKEAEAGDAKAALHLSRHPKEAMERLEKAHPEPAKRSGHVKDALTMVYGAAHREERAHEINIAASVAVFFIGFVVAYFLYLGKRDWADKMVGTPLHTLVYNKFYVDEIYQWTVVAGVRMGAAVLWFVVDRMIIDTLLVNGAGWIAYKAGTGVGRLHRGAIAAGVGLTAVGAAAILRYDLVLKAWHWFLTCLY